MACPMFIQLGRCWLFIWSVGGWRPLTCLSQGVLAVCTGGDSPRDTARNEGNGEVPDCRQTELSVSGGGWCT